MDIFSLGCLLHYVLTSGKHPFGPTTFLRMTNILASNPIGLDDDSLISYRMKVKDMIVSMLNNDPKKRPDISQIHAVFTSLGSSKKVEIQL